MLSISSIVTPNFSFFFFFNDTATTEIYTLSLHDALPICRSSQPAVLKKSETTKTSDRRLSPRMPASSRSLSDVSGARSEEHTSELQSQSNLVCRLLLEKKKRQRTNNSYSDPICS